MKYLIPDYYMVLQILSNELSIHKSQYYADDHVKLYFDKEDKLSWDEHFHSAREYMYLGGLGLSDIKNFQDIHCCELNGYEFIRDIFDDSEEEDSSNICFRYSCVVLFNMLYDAVKDRYINDSILSDCIYSLNDNLRELAEFNHEIVFNDLIMKVHNYVGINNYLSCRYPSKEFVNTMYEFAIEKEFEYNKRLCELKGERKYFEGWLNKVGQTELMDLISRCESESDLDIIQFFLDVCQKSVNRYGQYYDDKDVSLMVKDMRINHPLN